MRSVIGLMLFLLYAGAARGADLQQFGGGNTLALLKEDDLISGPSARSEETTAEQKDIPWYKPSVFGGRFGMLYPGESSETGNYLTGPMLGAYAQFSLGPGFLEITLDLVSLKTPPEAEDKYQLLFMSSASYIYKFRSSWFAGGGITFANASRINEVLLVQATGGIHLFGRADIALTAYIPAGNSNNSLFLGLTFGYRF